MQQGGSKVGTAERKTKHVENSVMPLGGSVSGLRRANGSGSDANKANKVTKQCFSKRKGISVVKVFDYVNPKWICSFLGGIPL